MTDDSPRPLAGVTVLDLSRIIAGPLVAQILAGLGADVIKVEMPGGGDPARAYVAENDTAGISPLFRSLNRDKRSIVLNLKHPEGVAVLRTLASGADVLLHNFRPGVAERLGIGYTDLRTANEGLVYCSISGFGDTGPMRTNAANDVIVQAFGGVMSFTGPTGGPPVRAGVSVSDVSAGLYAAIGVLSALVERATTGQGREIRTSLYESTVNLLAHNLVEYWINGKVPVPMGSGTSMGLPNEAFPTKDGSIVIAAVDEGLWRRLCAALGDPDLADDPRFVTLRDRRAHRVELFTEISALTLARSTAQCAQIVGEAGVPCAPINSIDDIAADPQFHALALEQQVADGDGGMQRLVRLPFSFDRQYAQIRHPAPALGADTAAVLDEFGYDAASRDRLFELGVVQ